MDTHTKIFVVVAFGAFLFFVDAPHFGAQIKTSDQEDGKHCLWLSDRLEEATSIKPGMSKADLTKVFMEDGGLQHFQPQRYVLRSCTLIKVDVTFEGPDIRGVTLDSALKVKSISKPYLEPMFMD